MELGICGFELSVSITIGKSDTECGTNIYLDCQNFGDLQKSHYTHVLLIVHSVGCFTVQNDVCARGLTPYVDIKGY